MSTHILRPSSLTFAGAGWETGPGSFAANIADASDGTHVYQTDGDDEFYVEYPDLALPATIVTVTSSFRHGRDGGSVQVRQFVRLAGNYTYGAWITPTTTAQTDEVLARPGGGTWTRADINSLQGGCISQFGTTDKLYVMDLWLTVLTRGGSVAFADLLSLVFGGGVFPAMAWQQFEAVRRELFRLTGTKILDDEVRAAIDAMRCDPRPRYFTAPSTMGGWSLRWSSASAAGD